jgi:hypothetical protein
MGYYGAKFVPESQIPPAIPAKSMIAVDAGDPRFSFNGPPLGAYHQHWAKEIGNLAKQYKVPFAMLHILEDTEQGRTTIPERMYWPDVIGIEAPILGVPAATLFSQVPAQKFTDYFYDQHFNDNGKELFTRAITPAILEVYDKRAQ